MDKKEAIEFLKKKAKEIPVLKEISYNNQSVIKWRNSIEDVLEVVFGRDSTEYTRFFKTRIDPKTSHGMNRLEKQKRYMRQLTERDTALQSIINKWKILGLDGKVSEKDVLVDTPIQLFDAMQFHPKVVEASRSCFVTANYSEAILNAFVIFIDFTKEKTNLDIDGIDLMNQVLSFTYDKEKKEITKYPIIHINGLKNKTDRDEQEGFWYLSKGAVTGIRNVYAHKLIQQTNPLHTLEYLAFASFLIRRVEEGVAIKLKLPGKIWNSENFLNDARKRFPPDKIEVMRMLIEFTKANSDAGILWGHGVKFGSFTFQKIVKNKPRSIFQIYTDGTFFLFFNKVIIMALLDRFRLNLNKIPGVIISESVIKEKDRYGSISLNLLINPSNFEVFQRAILSLCKDINNLDSMLDVEIP